MNDAAAISALGTFVTLIAGLASFVFAFVVFLLLVFINSHAKDIRDQLIALNAQIAGLRKAQSSPASETNRTVSSETDRDRCCEIRALAAAAPCDRRLTRNKAE